MNIEEVAQSVREAVTREVREAANDPIDFQFEQSQGLSAEEEEDMREQMKLEELAAQRDWA